MKKKQMKKEETNEVSIKEETNKVAVKEETNEVAIKEETNKVAVKEETNEVAVIEETNEVAIKEETNKIAVKEETNEVAMKEPQDIKMLENVEFGSEASTSWKMKPSLLNLPIYVIEKILSHFDLAEVSKLRVLSHGMMMSCGRILRLEVRRLMQDIDLLMKTLYQELSATESDAIAVRAPLLRCYNVLEVLRAELRMLFVLCRSSLTNAEQCFPGGHLLDEYHVILNKVKKRDIPTWSLDREVKLIRLSNKFLGGYIHEYSLSTKLGVRIVDLLDLLIEAGVALDVTYDLRVGCCHLFGKYKLLDIKFLSLPPAVTLQVLYPGRARVILDYFINIVRFNNRLLLRDEQFWREVEIGRRLQDQTGTGYVITRTGVVSRNPREYHTTRHCRERRILSDDYMIIRETYRESHEGNSNVKGVGFWCEVNLTCPISEAPLLIIESWKKLCSDMDKGKSLEISMSNHDTSVEILEYLELPRRRTLNNREFGSIFKEEVVAVYYPVQNDPQPLEDVSFSLENDSDRQRHLVVKCGNSKESLESTSDIYFLNVDLEVSMPVAKVYKLSFCDGNENIQESEIKETSL